MKRILIATVATIGFAGIAAAQQAPQLNGNYSANVLQSYNNTSVPSVGGFDFSATASIRNPAAPNFVGGQSRSAMERHNDYLHYYSR